MTHAPRYSYLQALWMSFYSADFYRDILHRREGNGFMYLLLLACVCAVLSGAALHVELYKGIEELEQQNANPVREWMNPVIEQIPAIKVSKGILSAEVQQPYAITAPDGMKLVVIDTTGKATSPEEEETVVLLTAHDVRVQSNDHYRVYSLEKITEATTQEPFTFDRNSARFLFEEFLAWTSEHRTGIAIGAWVLWMMFVPIGLFIALMFSALAYSLAAMLYAAIFKMELNYSTLLRVTSVALTPLALATTLVEIPTLVSIGATLLVLFTGMRAAKAV